MIFRQITHDDLGCASYLVGDERAGVAAVIDPRFEIDEYLELSRYRGVTIEHVLETHNHADHVSGHGRLVAATGARIHVHRLAAPDYEHEPFDDGWELELGTLVIRALHTPGHRPEHTAFALIDTTRGQEPWAVLSGDSLFVGDVARTDLAIDKTEGARQIFRSLHEKLLSLPDDCEVWPAHLGGSMCGGAGMSMKICSTIGFEKRHNPALGITDERGVHQAVHRQPGAAATELPQDRRAQPRRAADARSGGGRAVPPSGGAQARRGRPARRRANRPAVRRRPHPGLDQHPVLQPGLRVEARVARQPRRGHHLHRPRRRGRQARLPARAVRRDQQRRRHPGRRHDQLAPGAPSRVGDRAAHGRRAPDRMDADPSLQVLDVRELSEWNAGHIRARCRRHGTTSQAIPDGLDPPAGGDDLRRRRQGRDGREPAAPAMASSRCCTSSTAASRAGRPSAKSSCGTEGRLPRAARVC